VRPPGKPLRSQSRLAATAEKGKHRHSQKDKQKKKKKTEKNMDENEYEAAVPAGRRFTALFSRKSKPSKPSDSSSSSTTTSTTFSSSSSHSVKVASPRSGADSTTSRRMDAFLSGPSSTGAEQADPHTTSTSGTESAAEARAQKRSSRKKRVIPRKVASASSSLLSSSIVRQTSSPATSRCWRMRLLIVGQENVGKTSLLRAMKDRKWFGTQRDKRILSTDGIEIHRMTMLLPPAADSKDRSKVIFSCWDFAGQEIYYSSHQFFLTSNRAVFLVVWNISEDPQQSRLSYWLHSIQAHAGADVPIVMVATHQDQIPSHEQLVQRLKEVKSAYHSDFPNIRAFWSVNTIDGTNVTALKGILGQIAVSHPLLGQEYPSEWNVLERRLLQLRRARLRSHHPPCLSWKELAMFARKHCQMDHAALTECVRLFHQLGVLLHYDCTNLRVTGSLHDLCVLDCQWLIDLVKTLITTKHSFGKDGSVTFQQLRQLWDEERFPSSLHTALVGILQQFELAISLDPKQFDLSARATLLRGHETATVSQGDQPLLVPSLLSVEEPESVRDQQLSAGDSHPVDQFRVHYRFTFVPSFFPRLMVRLLQVKTDPPRLVVKQLWRQGLVFSWFPEKTANVFLVTLVLLSDARSLRIQIAVQHHTDNKLWKQETAELLRFLMGVCDDLLFRWYRKLRVSQTVDCRCEYCRQHPDSARALLLSELQQTVGEGRDTLQCTQLTQCMEVDLLDKPENASDGKCVLISDILPTVTLEDMNQYKTGPNLCIVLPREDAQTVLGEGGFGKVLKGELHRSGHKAEEVAVKLLAAQDFLVREAFADFAHEVHIMARCNHPCLVQMKAFQVSPAPMQLAMELLPHGTLYDYIHSPSGAVFHSADRSTLCPWFKQQLRQAKVETIQHRLRILAAYNIASALRTLHSMDPPIVHSDLKSPNVLLARLPHELITALCTAKKSNEVSSFPILAKVADFGESLPLYIPSLRRQAIVENPTWQAPEKEDTRASDVYSFGMILYEMLCGMHPFSEFTFAFQYMLQDEIAGGLRPSIPSTLPVVTEPYVKLMKECWSGTPVDRPTFSEILSRLTTMYSKK